MKNLLGIEIIETKGFFIEEHDEMELYEVAIISENDFNNNIDRDRFVFSQDGYNVWEGRDYKNPMSVGYYAVVV